jgi:ketosteroid isomerase-like protein
MEGREAEIQAMVDRETLAWDTQDVELLLSLFHPDMVWAWPPTNRDHDPVTWALELGRFDHARWTEFYQAFFDGHTLVHNRRTTQRVALSAQGDAALAVLDIDTLWQSSDGACQHWLGRVCKVYSRVDGAWKLIMHTGALLY